MLSRAVDGLLPRPAQIAVGGAHITLADRTGEETISVNSVTEVAVYKRDEIVTDLICCDIFTADGTVRTVHEEMPGFNDLIAAFKDLPGFDADWWGKVIKPAFVENWTVVYKRESGR